MKLSFLLMNTNTYFLNYLHQSDKISDKQIISVLQHLSVHPKTIDGIMNTLHHMTNFAYNLYQ